MPDQITYHLDGIVKTSGDAMLDFDGPLDLILYLLSKNKIEIRDIQISLILDQYMAWINQRKEMDLEVTSDFIVMASHLVYLKGRMLLAIGDEPDEEVNDLIESLEKRKNQERFENLKTVLPELGERWEFGRNIMIHPAETIEQDKRFNGTLNLSLLQKAFYRIEERAQKHTPPTLVTFNRIVGREPYPVSRKISDIVKQLFHTGVRKFKSLFSGIKSKSEAAATLLAVLDLYRNDKVDIEENENDYDIIMLDHKETENNA